MPVLLCLAAIGGMFLGAGALASGCAVSGGDEHDGGSTATGAATSGTTATGAITTGADTQGASTSGAAAVDEAGGEPVVPDGGVLVVFDGDSLTSGTGPPGTDYPSYTLEQLPKGVAMVNVAVPGQEWGDMLDDVEREVDPLFTPSARHNVVVVWAGTNDLHRTHTARRVWRELREYCLARRGRGWKVVVLTVLPKIPTESGCRFERQRRLLNHDIREHWMEVADALADVAHDKRVGDYAGLFGAQYKTDRVHLNADGNRVIADVVAGALRPLLTAGN